MSVLFAWNFDASPVVDYSGNGRGFALTGTSSLTAAGGGYTYGGVKPNAKALQQGGLEIQAGPAITGLNTAARTLQFWAKIDLANPSWLMELHDTNNDTGAFGLLFLSSSFRWRVKDLAQVVAEVPIAAPDPTVYHNWCLTHDGSTLKGYKDGVQIGTDVAVGALLVAEDLRVFDLAGNNTRLSDTRYFDEALSATDVNLFMNTPVEQPVIELGRAVETAQARTMDPTASAPLTQAVSSETARPLAPAASTPQGRAVSTETARKLAPSATHVFGRAIETAVARAMAAAGAVAFRQAASSEVSRPFAASLAELFGRSVEVEVARPLAATGHHVFGRAVEADHSRGFAGSNPGLRVYRHGVGVMPVQIGVFRHGVFVPSTHWEVSGHAEG